MNIDTARSYATEAAAAKAAESRYPDARFIIVCNRQGRFTPIFPKSMLGDHPMFGVAAYRFMVVG